MKGQKSSRRKQSMRRGDKDQFQEEKRGIRQNRERGTGSRSEGDKRLSSLNDISWYTQYPELAQASAMIPYPYRPGSKVNFGDYYEQTSTTDPVNADISIPGVMVLSWAPSVGVSLTQTDPASIVARELYSKVRSKFSGSLEADPPDFLMYLMALDSIFAYIGNLKRVYRLLVAYSPNNYIIPNRLLVAMGYNEQTISLMVQNRVKMWENINELIHMTRRFTCPATMDVFNRHYWMNDNVYLDSPEINAQMYVFNQEYYYKWALNPTPDNVDASGLLSIKKPDVNAAGGDPIQILYEYGKSLIDTLSGWDDAYTINGYLMRAYEDAPNFQVDLLLQDEVFAPVYVEEVLAQIESSLTVCNKYDGPSSFSSKVSQDPKTNIVISEPTITGTFTLIDPKLGLKPFINARKMVPDWQDNIIATRLSAYLEKTDQQGTYRVIAGTEVPLRWSIYTGTNGYNLDQRVELDTTAATTQPIDFATLGWLEAFDWHPFVMLQLNKGKGKNSTFVMCGDIHNITPLDHQTLKNLHKMCTFSEFNAFRS